MEEKSKEVKMESIKTGKEKKNLSYDELKKLAQDVFDENRFLRSKLYEAQQTIGMFNRLDYLLRIVEVNNGAKEWKFSNEFIQRCMEEIEIAMVPPKEEQARANAAAAEDYANAMTNKEEDN